MQRRSMTTIVALLAGIIFLFGCAVGQSGRQSIALLGQVDLDAGVYRHVSGAFEVQITSPDNIKDSPGDAIFLFPLSGGRNAVLLMNPEFTKSKGPGEVVEAMVAAIINGPYRGKKQVPSVLLREESTALGRKSLYARIFYPELPGSGLKQQVFPSPPSGPSMRDADFIGHHHIVPIADLNLIQGRLLVEYLLVSSELPGDRREDDRGGFLRHKRFLDRVKLLTPPGTSKPGQRL